MAAPAHAAAWFAAIKSGDLDTIKKLLSEDATLLNCQDESESENENENFGFGAAPPTGDTGLSTAIVAKQTDIATYLLEQKADPNICNHNNSSPLQIAASMAEPKLLELLLQHGAKFNVGNRERHLHMAVNAGKVENVEILLRFGAPINAYDEQQRTALNTAVHSPLIKDDAVRQKIVELLQNAGGKMM